MKTTTLTRISNYDIRKGDLVETYISHKLSDRLCDIYRWKTSLSPSYLNNIDKYAIRTDRRIEMRKRRKDLLLLIQNVEILGDGGNKICITYKNLVKPEYCGEVKKESVKMTQSGTCEYTDIMIQRTSKTTVVTHAEHTSMKMQENIILHIHVLHVEMRNIVIGN